MTMAHNFISWDGEHLQIELVPGEGSSFVLITAHHSPRLTTAGPVPTNRIFLSLAEAEEVHQGLGSLISEGERHERERAGRWSEEQTHTPSSGDRFYRRIDGSMSITELASAVLELEQRWDDLMKEALGIMGISGEEKR
jgi:hypothetical protein